MRLVNQTGHFGDYELTQTLINVQNQCLVDAM